MKVRIRSIGVIALAFLAATAVTGCWAPQPVGDLSEAGDEWPPYGVISTQQAVDVILSLQDDPEFVLLDIRTPAEVEAGHISGTISIDFYSANFQDDLAALDRDKIFLIYCRTANRTGQAYSIMEELGFERVYDMGGGISQWIAVGYPVCVGHLNAEHSCSGELPDESRGSLGLHEASFHF